MRRGSGSNSNAVRKANHRKDMVWMQEESDHKVVKIADFMASSFFAIVRKMNVTKRRYSELALLS